MKALPRIEAVYLKIDKVLEEERSKANPPEALRIEAQQVLNDQAYYVLCWRQLESEIDDVCRGAIRKRRASGDWHVRRARYLYNPDDKKLSGLSFEDRVALVLDKEANEKYSPGKRTMAHYGTRNEIAHGTLKLTRIDVSAFMRDCFAIQAALYRAA
ncbi:MAG TPA: hypothetical protein VH414_11500 [Lichenihabitans sp.]|nr:hypothetical protein [Lichenihabitans sp.]